jgi:hypothetical protein
MMEKAKTQITLAVGAVFLIVVASIVIGAVRRWNNGANFRGAPIAPSTPSSTFTLRPTPASLSPSSTFVTPDTSGMRVVTIADNFGMVHLAMHQQFLVRLGSSLDWALSFDPSGVVSAVSGFPVASGTQGVFEATALGTTVLHASGRPLCKIGQMCALFIAEVNITFVVGP